MRSVIIDGTGTNAAAVKPALTPAEDADPALVVTLSPNSAGIGGGGGVASTVALANGSKIAIDQTTPGTTNGVEVTNESLSVTGTFWQATQPISGSVSVSNLPASQAVTGTFWQATQPVSAASLPLPSGAATSAKQPTLDADGGAPAHVTNWPTTQPVSGSVGVSGSVAVTGTFWQATQPVSLATNTPDVTDRSGRLLGHVTVDSAPTTAVTGTFWQATQPVSIASMPSTPVTGTFWQSTQPVSLTSLPSLAAGTALIGKVGIDQTTPGTTNGVSITNSSLAVTGTFWQATQPVSGSVSVSNFPATQPVSGTFWQATQPVSLATNTPDVTDRSARLLGHVTVDSAPTTAVTGTFWQATQPVSGTFWQATQPVSIASMPSTPVTGTFWQATQPVSGTVAVSTLPTAVAKGTQGATGVPTQDLKDSGRTAVVLNASGIATIVAATLVTVQKYVAGTVTTGVTEYVVTAGKTLRVQSIVITFRPTTPSTTVTFVSCTWSFRRGTVTLTATSSLVGTATGMVTTNTPSIIIDFDVADGLEFAAGDHIGFTQASSATTGTFDLTLIGFEY